MAKLSLKNINKIYPNGFHAIHDFNLEIDDGEFIVFVGPSGCGKSTMLRMIAGLEEITSGEFTIDGEKVNKLAPVDRDVAMVFQNYALYYNMSVYDNIGISLKIRHEQKQVIHKEVKDAAERFDLSEYLNRFPANLSGGQRQRVALGRTVVRNPKVFLMDEPLSNLDAKLRSKTRSEIVQLQKSLGTTTIYVTHDQIEAMTMADRIVIMKDGVIQQVGKPSELYDLPSNIFVAQFIGTPSMNMIEGKIDGNKFVSNSLAITIPDEDLKKLEPYQGQEVILGVRPEDICTDGITMNEYPNSIVEMNVELSEFLGKEYYVHLNINNLNLIARINSRDDVDVDKMKIVFNMKKVHFFDKNTTSRIVED